MKITTSILCLALGMIGTTISAEPELWHHDILRPDGRPYQQSEIDLMKSLTAEE